jgi:hypothetical protein
VSLDKRRGPSSPKLDPHRDATEAAKPLKVGHQGTDGNDSSRRLLVALVGYVAEGRDRPAIDRFTTAAEHAAELVNTGADRVAVVASLTLAGEAAELPRWCAEDVVRSALRNRCPR